MVLCMCLVTVWFMCECHFVKSLDLHSCGYNYAMCVVEFVGNQTIEVHFVFAVYHELSWRGEEQKKRICYRRAGNNFSHRNTLLYYSIGGPQSPKIWPKVQGKFLFTAKKNSEVWEIETKPKWVIASCRRQSAGYWQYTRWSRQRYRLTVWQVSGR